MTDSLKKKTVSGLIWNAIDKVGFQIIAFVVGVITARLLSPRDFGLIGALSLFTVLSNILIDSGFTSALIRRKEVNNQQYTGVFYLNMVLSIVLYSLLYVTAPYISIFFKMPELTMLARFIFLSIIFNSLGLIQITILTKEFKFKVLTYTNLVSLLITSIVTIWMSITGYSYWAIAWQQVLIILIRSICLWIFSSWRPSFKPDFSIIKELFRFSSNILITGIMNVAGKNLYNIIIGKLYTIQELGFYSQAQKYQIIPSSMITATLQGVSLPVLSALSHNEEKQIQVYRKITRIAAFLIFPIMLTFYALAEPFVSIILTDKWLQSVAYFKILIIASLVFPFQILSLNLLIARGNSKKYLQLEIVKNIFVVCTIGFGFRDISTLLISYAGANFLSFLVDIFVIEKLTGYTLKCFFKDILPYLIISIGIVIFVRILGQIPLEIYLKTTIQLFGSVLFYILWLKVLGSTIYKEAILLIKGKEF